MLRSGCKVCVYGGGVWRLEITPDQENRICGLGGDVTFQLGMVKEPGKPCLL